MRALAQNQWLLFQSGELGPGLALYRGPREGTLHGYLREMLSISKEGKMQVEDSGPSSEEESSDTEIEGEEKEDTQPTGAHTERL